MYAVDPEGCLGIPVTQIEVAVVDTCVCGQSRRVMSQRYGESRRWDGDDVDDSVGAQSIVQS